MQVSWNRSVFSGVSQSAETDSWVGMQNKGAGAYSKARPGLPLLFPLTPSCRFLPHRWTCTETVSRSNPRGAVSPLSQGSSRIGAISLLSGYLA